MPNTGFILFDIQNPCRDPATVFFLECNLLYRQQAVANSSQRRTLRALFVFVVVFVFVSVVVSMFVVMLGVVFVYVVVFAFVVVFVVVLVSLFMLVFLIVSEKRFYIAHFLNCF